MVSFIFCFSVLTMTVKRLTTCLEVLLQVTSTQDAIVATFIRGHETINLECFSRDSQACKLFVSSDPIW